MGIDPNSGRRLLRGGTLGLILGLLALSSLRSSADIVDLEWKANTETNLIGYRVYLGFVPGYYAITNAIQPEPRARVSLTVPDQVYWLAVTAVNDRGQESGFSDEVTVTNSPGASFAVTNVVLETPEDSALTLPFVAGEREPGASWIPVENPGLGTLSGSVDHLVYTPDFDKNGPDTFRYLVIAADGFVTKVAVEMRILPGADLPVALGREFRGVAGQPLQVFLQAFDVDGEPLEYEIVTPPQYGTLAGSGNIRTYLPTDPGWNGLDSFEFRVTDGEFPSASALNTILIEVGNQPPSSGLFAAIVLENTSVSLLLPGKDPEGGPVLFEMAEPPRHGTLEGTPPSVVYTPITGFEGQDGFSFRVRDLDGGVGLLQVLLSVQKPFIRPQPWVMSVTVSGGIPGQLRLPGNEPGVPRMWYQFPEGPQHGRATGTPPWIVYEPDPGFRGQDRITYKLFEEDGPIGDGILLITVQEPTLEPPSTGTTVASNGRLVMGWKVGPGGRYEVHFTRELETAEWAAVGLVALEPTETMVYWTIEPGEARSTSSGFLQVIRVGQGP